MKRFTLFAVALSLCLGSTLARAAGPSPIVYFELVAKNATMAKEFYERLFGWTITVHTPDMNYMEIDAAGMHGGLRQESYLSGENPGTLLYVEVQDLRASMQIAESMGASVAIPPMEIPNTGWFSIITDPNHTAIGLFAKKMN